jgi:putative peptide zinc metalloprotease protein
MRSSLFSPSWYRVSSLKPRLRSHAQIHRHEYRGETWFVLQDHTSGRFLRFTPGAYSLIGLMDGQRTVQEIWEAGQARVADEGPTQEEIIRLLSQLHATDVLLCDVSPDTLELFRRYEKKQMMKWQQNIRNPLSMRFKLFDPEKFLQRWIHVVRPLLGWVGAVAWTVVVGWAVILTGLHWAELTENVTDRVLAPENLLLIWLIFPILKALHEFGHAFAIKHLGGEVHEMGIIFLVFTPIPYVDASSSSAFRDKWQRAFVGAAGCLVELFIAALAVFVWVNVEPGPFRSAAYNVLLVAGVSSLFFNLNPLLRYDGYYILADILEIPNLGSRGMQYMGYLVQYYLFDLRDVEPPVSTPGERAWFVIYSVSSFLYRIVIYVAIIIFVANKFFFIGVLFALWAVFSMIFFPVYKAGKFLFASPRLGPKRSRAIAISAAICLTALALFCLIPFPLSTRTEGVLWVPEDSIVRAGTEGVVERLEAVPGAEVKPGQLLARCSDPYLPARIRVFQSRVDELSALYDSQILTDRVQAHMTLEELGHAKGQLNDALAREKELSVESRKSGTFLVPNAQDLPGRFLKRGEVLGYIVDPSEVTIRVVVSQTEADLVRAKTRGVQIRLPERFGDIADAALKREIPAATDQLPARSLGQTGGGTIAMDPRDTKGMKSFQKLFLFDVEMPADDFRLNVGSRVYVRFDHGYEPVAFRWYRELRQLLLKSFNV